jgi:hypothetical protein
MTPTKRFVSLADCVAFMYINEITSPAKWFDFRLSPNLSDDQRNYVDNLIPYDPTVYYGIRWVDILPAAPDYKPRQRLFGVQYLSLPKATALLRSLDYSRHYHKDYQKWLLLQPMEIRQQLPRDPARHYGKAFYAPSYFQKLYSFDQARKVLRRESITSSRRYKHAVKGHPERAAGFQVSQQFLEVDRFHLPIDFSHYVPVDAPNATYAEFFGKPRVVRRSKVV